MAQAVMFSPPDFVNQLHQQRLLTRPEVHKMTKLDEMISETLARTDISDSEKYDLYNAALADFQKTHRDVLKMGSQMTVSPNLFSDEMKQSKDQISGDQMINTVAEILQKLQEAGSSVKNENVLQSSASSVKKKVSKNESHADKLAAELRRDGRFKKNLEDTAFSDKTTGVFNDPLWKKTMNFLTQKRLNIKTVPSEVMGKAQDVYNFMISNKIDLNPWMTGFPLFRHLSSQNSMGKRVSKKVGKGRLPHISIDWDSWDSDLKKK